MAICRGNKWSKGTTHRSFFVSFYPHLFLQWRFQHIINEIHPYMTHCLCLNHGIRQPFLIKSLRIPRHLKENKVPLIVQSPFPLIRLVFTSCSKSTRISLDLPICNVNTVVSFLGHSTYKDIDWSVITYAAVKSIMMHIINKNYERRWCKRFM